MNLYSIASFFCLLILQVTSDGQRDYGEACSLRSQVANYFRQNDSPEGCMSDKSLICVSHKCICDPTSIYETKNPGSSSSSDDSSSSTGVRANVKTFFKKLMGSESTTTPQPILPIPSSGGGGNVSGGRCVGRAGSPCLTANAVCVEHASCQGSPPLCRCNGIYSSNTQGRCSKTAGIANQALKRIVPGFSGRK